MLASFMNSLSTYSSMQALIYFAQLSQNGGKCEEVNSLSGILKFELEAH